MNVELVQTEVSLLWNRLMSLLLAHRMMILMKVESFVYFCFVCYPMSLLLWLLK